MTIQIIKPRCFGTEEFNKGSICCGCLFNKQCKNINNIRNEKIDKIKKEVNKNE